MLLSLWRNIHLALALSCSVILIILSVTGVVLSLEPIQHRASSLHIGSAADRSLGDFIAELQEKYIEIIEVIGWHEEFFAHLSKDQPYAPTWPLTPPFKDAVVLWLSYAGDIHADSSVICTL